MPPEPPLRVGHFRLEQELGRGGMGVVYRAIDESLRRPVALKLLTEGFAEDPERRARFFREARAAATVAHPNVVVVHEVGEDAGRIFIAMELVQGRPLSAWHRDGALSVGDVVSVGRQVASALARAHERGVVHRDLKPDNVMLDAAGHATVLDFGIAKQTLLAPEDATQRGDGPTTVGIVGTPAYMSPEQLLGGASGPPSDVFSFGVMLYELLGGARPFPAESLGALVVAVVRDVPTPLLERAPGLDPGLAALVMRCLDKDPEARFRDGAELVAALDAASGGAGQLSVHPARPPARESGLALDATELAPRRSEPRPPRRGLRPAVVAGVVLIGLAGLAALATLRRVPSKAPPHASASGSAVAASPVTTVLDLPAPPGASDEVLGAWRAALGALREGAMESVRLRLEGVLEREPSFVSAHVQLAAESLVSNLYDAAAREHWRRADRERARLSPRDGALLDALGPLLLRSPADYEAAIERFARATERFPGDAQLWFYRGIAESMGPVEPLALNSLERALSLDPGYGAAAWYLAQILAYAGRRDDARRLLERCVREVATAALCRWELARLLEVEGRCADAEETVRGLVIVAAEQGRTQRQLAAALVSRGALTAAREALKAAYPEGAAGVRSARLEDEARFAAVSGDFALALRRAREAQAALGDDRREAPHGRLARLRALLLDEVGDPGGASRVAAEFLARRAALEPNPKSDDFALAAEALPWLLPFSVRGGRVGVAEAEATLSAWNDGWSRRLHPGAAGYLWPHGWATYAFVVGTAEAGRRAVAAVDATVPLPEYHLKSLAEASVGAALLLGGRTDDGIAWLERAVAKCVTLDFPIEQARAALLLGRAREAKGDAAAACKAYGLVLGRWPTPAPRSVTADAAKARSRALRCPG